MISEVLHGKEDFEWFIHENDEWITNKYVFWHSLNLIKMGFLEYYVFGLFLPLVN